MIDLPSSAPSHSPALGNALSIMIPTFNCAPLLERTLLSLRDQPGIERASIEVVDNCSSDEPERIVQKVWPGRVLFHRHPENIGAIRNFNACIDRAQTEWLHILHGDDLAEPAAYLEFAAAAALVPDARAVFGRTRFIDPADHPFSASAPLGPAPRGRFVYDPVEWGGSIVQCAGVLLSKSAIRAVGPFDPHFRHVADWNLFWRIASRLPVAYTNAFVGDYRIHASSLTAAHRRNAVIIPESLEQTNLIVRHSNAGAASTRLLYARLVGESIVHLDALVGDAAFSASLKSVKGLPRAGFILKNRLRLLRSRFRHLLCLRGTPRITN